MDKDVEIEDLAKSVVTFQDFQNFLNAIEKEILEDDEANERLQIEFLRVTARKLGFSSRFPNLEDLDIEIPDQPDWNWLARLLVIGVFEN